MSTGLNKDAFSLLVPNSVKGQLFCEGEPNFTDPTLRRNCLATARITFGVAAGISGRQDDLPPHRSRTGRTPGNHEICSF